MFFENNHIFSKVFRRTSSFVASGLLAALCVMTPEIQAAPSEGDPIGRLIQERFLSTTDAVSQQTEGVVKRVRDTASDLVVSAMNFLGVKYRFGGSSAESGFDCSGFTRYVFENSLGLILPRRASDQASFSGLLTVNSEELKPGDLVFFNTMRRAFSHVGIYVGDNKFIHAPRTGANIRIDDLQSSYWQSRFEGARRAPALTSGSTPFRLPAELLPNGTGSPQRGE